MWIILGRSECKYCDLAKGLLTSMGLPFTEYKVDTPEDRWLARLLMKAGYKTVPQIYNQDGVHVGGFTELKELFTEGPL